ncbi:MAG: hypothetical protein AAGL68_06870, partial [Pseudomonadota bacterium]
MNWVAGSALVAVGAGLFWMFVEQAPADVYDMPVNQAYALLKDADLDAGYVKLKTGGSERTSTTSGFGGDRAVWWPRFRVSP